MKKIVSIAIAMFMVVSCMGLAIFNVSAAGSSVIQFSSKEITVGVEEIVLDDIVMYKGGRQIVADSLILEGNCQVNESLLTGESDLIRKKEGDTLLSGSFVVSGNAVSKVINVGEDNYVNKITKQAKYLDFKNIIC